MLLVILGAGASFDSSPLYPPTSRGEMRGGNVEDARPPLTLDLFNPNRTQSELLLNYPMASAVVDRLRKEVAAGGNLERSLATLQTESDAYAPRRLHLMAVRFYLRDFLRDCSLRWWKLHSASTTYSQFVDEVNQHSPDVCYVTFNYDTLLDSTLQSLRLRNLDTIDGYVAPGGPLYVKVHGSVNWRRRIVDLPTPNNGTMSASAVMDSLSVDVSDTGGIYEVEANPDWWGWRKSDDSQFTMELPALAIPVEAKLTSNFETPRPHLGVLAQAIHAASRVLVVGWRASEPHFAQILLANKPGLALPFTLVCGPDGSETDKNLRALGFVDVADTHMGFSEFVVGGHLRAFLESAERTE